MERHEVHLQKNISWNLFSSQQLLIPIFDTFLSNIYYYNFISCLSICIDCRCIEMNNLCIIISFYFKTMIISHVTSKMKNANTLFISWPDNWFSSFESNIYIENDENVKKKMCEIKISYFMAVFCFSLVRIAMYIRSYNGRVWYSH